MEASVYSIPLCEENTHYRYTFIVLGNLKNQPLFSSWFMYYLCNYLFTPSYVLFKLLLLLLLLLFMTIFITSTFCSFPCFLNKFKYSFLLITIHCKWSKFQLNDNSNKETGRRNPNICHGSLFRLAVQRAPNVSK